MATSGPNQSGVVVADDRDGESPWTNAGNAKTFDQVYATCDMFGGGKSDFLDYTTFGTFTGIGAGDSITAILVEVAGKGLAGGKTVILSVQLIVGGVLVGSASTAGSGTFGTSESYVAFAGGAVAITDLGTTLVGSQLDSTFGVEIQLRDPVDDDTVSIDACRVTLTYTPSGGSFNPGCVKATNGIAGSGAF